VKSQLDIFIFIDALGWDLVQKHDFLLAELPFRRKIEMQFGYSCTAVPTILTGCRPNQHGHLSFFYYDPQNSPFKALKILHHLLRPRSFWNRGRVRNLLSKIIRKFYGYTGYFQLYQVPFDRIGYFNYCEKKDLFAPGGLAPLSNLQDLLIESGLPYHISNWRQNEVENLAAARQAIGDDKTQFLFVYLAEMDSLLHEQVGKKESEQAKMQDYQTQISNLLEEARKHAENVTLTLFSDHGMTPLKGTVDLKKMIEGTGLQFAKDYAACFDSTMLRVWFLRPESKEIIKQAINGNDFPGHWLVEEEKKRYGIAGGPVNYGDEIFLLDPGYQIVPSDMGLKPLPGMHGYQPDDKDSLAALLSTHPPPEKIREVADLFTLMQESIDRLSRKEPQPSTEKTRERQAQP
jgi:predicted AlkP superfamily pyrophosphatase or phosphodiesterase